MIRAAVRAARRLRPWLPRLRHPARHFLTFPPGHPHSPLPAANAVGPAMAEAAGSGDDLPGIDLQPDAQLALLRELAPLARDWPFPERPTAGFRYHVRNDFFLETDGPVLYALLRYARPARVVEVGSGFSSALMLDTVDRHSGPAVAFTFIDPDPGRLLGLLTLADRDRCTVVPHPVQEADPAVFDQLARGDVLFIDSSHVCKLGSDVNHLLFRVLPRLAPGVRVHVHDIFWPFEYPEATLRLGWAWNEAYVLRAFLQFNHAFRVLLWPSHLEARRPADFRAVWPTPSNPTGPAHASLWLERTG